MILCLVRTDKGDEAKKIVENLIKAQPDNWLNLELKGRVLRELDDNAGAVKVYETMLERIAKDDRLTKDEQQLFTEEVKYTLTGVYIELKQIDKATDILQELLKIDPDNPTYNNDLGYIWADHDKNIDQSEKLIRKALEEDRKQRHGFIPGWFGRFINPIKPPADIKPEDDKDNPSYVDSLGWVLFKQKKCKEAKAELERAVKDEDGKHVEIYDHLGEACLALNEKKEAVEAWKKGIEVAGPSKREQAKKVELEKKVKDNQ
jgi:predicted Zn-dependent protease